MIEFICENCGKKMGANDDAAGSSGRCLGCGETVVVPLIEDALSCAADSTRRVSFRSAMATALAGIVLCGVVAAIASMPPSIEVKQHLDLPPQAEQQPVPVRAIQAAPAPNLEAEALVSIRKWLKENTGSGKWEEVIWIPPRELAGFKQQCVIDIGKDFKEASEEQLQEITSLSIHLQRAQQREPQDDVGRRQRESDLKRYAQQLSECRDAIRKLKLDREDDESQIEQMAAPVVCYLKWRNQNGSGQRSLDERLFELQGNDWKPVEMPQGMRSSGSLVWNTVPRADRIKWERIAIEFPELHDYTKSRVP